jgi:hypothetical protein
VTLVRSSPASQKSNDSSIRRYISLTSAVHILQTKSITLLSPNTWDDKNDTVFMNAYMKSQNKNSILALCFSQATETYHHWKIFSSGTEGVCIEFDTSRLIKYFDKFPELRHEPVKYKTLSQLKTISKAKIDDLPFIKRWAYKPEDEYRLVYTSNNKDMPYLDVPISIGCIKRVTLSPWLNQRLAKVVAERIRSINGCKSLTVSRSTLVGNSAWQETAAIWQDIKGII